MVSTLKTIMLEHTGAEQWFLHSGMGGWFYSKYWSSDWVPPESKRRNPCAVFLCCNGFNHLVACHYCRAANTVNHGFKSHCNSSVDASADTRVHEWFDIKSLSLQSLACKHLHIRKETDCVGIDVVLVHGGKRCSYLHLCRAKPGQCSPQVTQGCPLCGSSAGFSLWQTGTGGDGS